MDVCAYGSDGSQEAAGDDGGSGGEVGRDRLDKPAVATGPGAETASVEAPSREAARGEMGELVCRCGLLLYAMVDVCTGSAVTAFFVISVIANGNRRSHRLFLSHA